ncbi:MAG TPA: hypothetical protein PKA16_13510 [Ottowia sp.]|uniref:hypothetical protein n=1 Tax=Ottowia sp. TaxID=1898956 RepID=UPI002C9B4195|nr:hypothetical protein [Ottowia sp.]HMN22396.1 hypothetical protein [Ottowia sp.]
MTDRHQAAGPGAPTQAAHMRAAIHGAVALAPQFLRGELAAEKMAQAMIDAARQGSQPVPGAASGESDDHLRHVLAELYGCGSGYLAGRCDAA